MCKTALALRYINTSECRLPLTWRRPGAICLQEWLEFLGIFTNVTLHTSPGILLHDSRATCRNEYRRLIGKYHLLSRIFTLCCLPDNSTHEYTATFPLTGVWNFQGDHTEWRFLMLCHTYLQYFCFKHDFQISAEDSLSLLSV